MNTPKDKIRAAAQKYLQKGQIDRAIREFQRLVEDDPSDVRTLLKIGDLQARLHNTAAATQTYADVAEYYAGQGFSLKAVAVYKQVLGLDPNRLAICRKLAETYVQLGLISDAINQYRLLCQLCESKSMWGDCIAAAERLVALDSTNVATVIKLAEMHARAGNIQEAVAGFRGAAAELERLSRLDEWAKVLERVVQLAPTDAPSCQALATYYFNHDDPRRALGKLQIAFKVDAQDFTTLALLAEVFEALEQPTKALSALRELVLQQQQRQDLTGSEKTLRSILRLNPQESEANDLLQAVVAQRAASLSPKLETDQALAGTQGASPLEASSDDIITLEPLEDEMMTLEPLDGDEVILTGELVEADKAPSAVPKDSSQHNSAAQAVEVELEIDVDIEVDTETHAETKANVGAITPLAVTATYRQTEAGDFTDLNTQLDHPMMFRHEMHENSQTDAPQASQPPPVKLADESKLAEALNDLAGGLAVDLADADSDLNTVFDNVFDEFASDPPPPTAGTSTAANDNQDLATHFDLGIAYKEMGMLTEAIAEFERTIAFAKFEVNACTMVGLCQLEMGDTDAALIAFRRGLSSPQITSAQATALRYEVGLAYESMGQIADARKFYQKTYEMNPQFRDVAARLTQAQSAFEHSPEASSSDLDILLDDAAAP